MNSSEGPLWKEAIKSAIVSILQIQTWELVDLPLGSKALGYKWIFKRKTKSNGTIDKFKEILVIKGYKQNEGLDYFICCKTLENSNFLKNDKMVISVKIRNFSISRMTKRTSPLESSREI